MNADEILQRYLAGKTLNLWFLFISCLEQRLNLVIEENLLPNQYGKHTEHDLTETKSACLHKSACILRDILISILGKIKLATRNFNSVFKACGRRETSCKISLKSFHLTSPATTTLNSELFCW